MELRPLRPLPALGLLLVAGGLLVACTSVPVNSVVPAMSLTPPPSDSQGHCVVEYSALLDLADLARRYGQSAGIFLDAIGDMVDQLDACLSGSGGINREIGVLKIRAELWEDARWHRRVVSREVGG